MRTVFSFPGNMADAQNSALALDEAGCLDSFVTSLNWRPTGRMARVMSAAGATRVLRQAARKSIGSVRPERVRTYPLGETLRLATCRLSGNAALADRVWDWSSHRFDRLVARNDLPRAEAIEAYEYTALRSFERAADLGVARLLHLVSLDNLSFRAIQQRERREVPELGGDDDGYFEERFQPRYRRRLAEIALADVLIANSSLTARSHIAAGADPARVRVVPLAAPPPLACVRDDPSRGRRPMTVLWAGTFSLRKGAHYMLAAWRMLAAGDAAQLDIYGAVDLPARLLQNLPANIVWRGSVPQPELFAAYARADVLAFPTLSDGFGMVVTEAFAHGLPVIASDQAGAADLVDDKNGLIVPAADPAALARALRWCLDHPDRLTDMRHFALATAARRQWRDFRRELVAALDGGLRAAGYSPSYKTPSDVSRCLA